MSGPGEHLLDQQAAAAATEPAQPIFKGEAKVIAHPTIVWGSYHEMHFQFEEGTGSGYLWEAKLPEGVKFTDEAIAPETDDIGSNRTRHFTIQVNTPMTMIFQMRRPWEHQPIRKVTISVE